MKTKAIVAALALAAVLSGCAKMPQLAWGTPAGVSFYYDPLAANFGGANQGHAAIEAQKWCAQYGKNARLSRIDAHAAANEAVFDCVPK